MSVSESTTDSPPSTAFDQSFVAKLEECSVFEVTFFLVGLVSLILNLFFIRYVHKHKRSNFLRMSKQQMQAHNIVQPAGKTD